MFCDQSAPAVCDCCSSYGTEICFFSRYEFFEVFSHLGPLLKRPRLNLSFGLTGVCRLAIWGAIEGLGPLPTTKSAVF